MFVEAFSFIYKFCSTNDVGTSVGSKVTAVAEKVATDTAEDLKQAAGSFEGDIPGSHGHSVVLLEVL